MGKIIGIDLGTTNSVVAVMEGSEPTVIANREGNRLTPSVVAFTKDGERLVGQIARRQAVTNPEKTVYSIKRFMGRHHSEVASARREASCSYKVQASGNPQDARVKVGDSGQGIHAAGNFGDGAPKAQRRPQRISWASPSPRRSSLCPAYFNDSQRQATKDAGQDRRASTSSASSMSRRPPPWPTASDKKTEETIVVYDFGGGTFDISILEVGDNVVEVKSHERRHTPGR